MTEAAADVAIIITTIIVPHPVLPTLLQGLVQAPAAPVEPPAPAPVPPVPVAPPPVPPTPVPAPAEPDTVTHTTAKLLCYAQQRVGAPVTDSRDQAYSQCKATVERLAAHCRAKNRRFRDLEFDIETDDDRCLYSLSNSTTYPTSDVRRVTAIFDKPVFYSGTTRSTEVAQTSKEASDGYLISALTNLTSMPGLVERLCVARDEAVGIYGFIFYRDCYWVPVIIDDLLFTRVPKYEELNYDEKELYHFDKEKYEATARRGGDSLYFARPVRIAKDAGQASKDGDDSLAVHKGTEDGETWIPLVEKAYAKLHGDYASVMQGYTNDALEDLTGGCSSVVLTKDILDPDQFWKDELLNTNKDRLFGCWFGYLDGTRSGVPNATVEGLRANTSYSVLKAVEINGKRFVVLRDPLGSGSWEGAWSDGSKQWTSEWLKVLPELGHSFGVNGQFVMEYKDFLNVWDEIQKTRIFDDSWVMSYQWLSISQTYPKTNAWSYGDVSFTFTLPKASPATVVLSQYDHRYFKDIQGPFNWNFDFIIAKQGDTEPIAESSYAFFHQRSISVELDLSPGTYVVLVRPDPFPHRDKEYYNSGVAGGWNRRKLALVLTAKAQAQSLAANVRPNPDYLPTDARIILSSEQTAANKSVADVLSTHGSVKPGESVTVTTTTTTTTVVSKSATTSTAGHVRFGSNPPPVELLPPPSAYGYTQPAANPVNDWGSTVPGPSASIVYAPATPIMPTSALPPAGPAGGVDPTIPLDAPPPEYDTSVVIGLKVYTKKHALSVITGRLKPLHPL